MLTNGQVTDVIETQSVCKNFLDQVRRSPSQIALKWKVGDAWESYSYSELANQIARVSSGLKELGVGEGDRVLMLLSNRFEFHVVDLACLYLKATPISVYNSSSPEQIAKIAEASQAEFAVVEDEFCESFDQARKVSSSITHCVRVGSKVGNFDSLYQELADGEPLDLDVLAADISQDFHATLIFTSGTTGDPKGVVLDHANVSWTVSCLRRLIVLDKYEGTRMISYLPMAHIAERMVSHYVGLLSGFEITCCPAPTLVADYASEVQPNILFGVPRVYEKIYAKVKVVLEGEDPSAAKRAIAALKMKLFSKKIRSKIGLDKLIIAVSGGAPLSPQVMEWFQALGVPLSEIYGLSETSGPMTWDPYKSKLGSVGRPCPGVEVKLADDGEIMCRGGNIFREYLGRPDLTRQVLSEAGWFSTGDVGEIDADGYVRVVDRKKEIIVTSGGKNVAPAAIENALKLIPLVGQAMVVGEGQKFVSAVVALDPEAAVSWADKHGLEGSDLQELCAEPALVEELNLATAKAMSSFSSVEQVKKISVVGDDWQPDGECLTPTSKLKRKVIAAKYQKEIAALYK